MRIHMFRIIYIYDIYIYMIYIYIYVFFIYLNICVVISAQRYF